MFAKKLIATAAGVTVLGMMTVGRDACSYVGTSCSWVKESVKNSVPLDFEIDRARTMIKNLVPDIRANMHLIAKEEVEVEKLGKQVVDTQTKLDKDRDDLLRLKTDISSGRESFKYGSRVYTVAEVKTDLSRRFERFKTQDATLSSLREMQSAREKSLTAARQKLEGMLSSKRQLEVDVEHLEARLKMVEAAQTTSNYQFDDNRLSRVKELVGDLRTRLNVAEKLVQADTSVQDEISLDTPDAESIVEQVTEYFGEVKPGQLADVK